VIQIATKLSQANARAEVKEGGLLISFLRTISLYTRN